jgi:hypothetical protein
LTRPGWTLTTIETNARNISESATAFMRREPSTVDQAKAILDIA